MDHLQINVWLTREKETSRFARLIGRKPREAAGWLLDFWSACAIHFRDGFIPKDTEDQDLEHVIGWEGKLGVLAQALRLEGYIDATTGEIAGWKKRYGSYLATLKAKREREKQRRDAARAAVLAAARDPGVGGPSSSGRVRHVSDTIETRVTVERERERDENEMKLTIDDARAPGLLLIDGKATAAREIVVSLFSFLEKEAEQQAARLVKDAGPEIAEAAARQIAPYARLAGEPKAYIQSWLDRHGWKTTWKSKDAAPPRERPPEPIGPSRRERDLQAERDKTEAENAQAAENRRKIEELARSIGKGKKP